MSAVLHLQLTMKRFKFLRASPIHTPASKQQPTENPNCGWLQGMGGSAIGVWCAHGEGQCIFPDEGVKQAVTRQSLAPIRWGVPACRQRHWQLQIAII